LRHRLDCISQIFLFRDHRIAKGAHFFCHRTSLSSRELKSHNLQIVAYLGSGRRSNHALRSQHPKERIDINILNPSTIQNFSLKLLLPGIAPSLFKIIIPRRRPPVRLKRSYFRKFQSLKL
jgi:hypothetical protein